jgi:hypothetical protein
VNGRRFERLETLRVIVSFNRLLGLLSGVTAGHDGCGPSGQIRRR